MIITKNKTCDIDSTNDDITRNDNNDESDNNNKRETIGNVMAIVFKTPKETKCVLERACFFCQTPVTQTIRNRPMVYYTPPETDLMVWYTTPERDPMV